MDGRINMTADEFFDHWSEWCSMPVSVKEGNLLTEVMTNILRTFEERGSPTHKRQVLRDDAIMFVSPDLRAENV